MIDAWQKADLIDQKWRVLLSVAPTSTGWVKSHRRMIRLSGETGNAVHRVRHGEVSERPERPAQGYRRFKCHACGKQFNERSGGILNLLAQYPSDVFVVFWRLRYKPSLCDLPEMFLILGVEFSCEAARDWEAKLTPS